ncbi:YycH family regulatory protein [Alloiococcus otitis]|uniref:YycH family regulatory protein n=1 Tax=Alloiococcus otitis TaxID=1652 RepID=UPI002353B664|nr:two-component system activity regulator YycH [Alloiococcus otitis]
MTYSRIKHVILALLILLSIYLSYKIWVPVSDQADGELSQGDNLAPSSLVERDTNEVYSPHQFIYHQEDESWSYDPSVFNDSFSRIIENMSLDTLDEGEDLSLDDYQDQVAASQQSLELVFSAPLPFGLFGTSFENIPTDLADQEFDKVLIDLESPQEIDFYNSQAESLYQVDLVSLDLSEVEDLLADEGNRLFSVYPEKIQNKYAYLPNTEVVMQDHYHVVERLPNSLYSTHFFPDPSGVELRVSNNISRYIDLQTELRINNASDVLTYFRQLSDLNEMSTSERFIASRNELNTLENWPNEIKYEGVNNQFKQVVYRRYYDGWPIFSEGDLNTLTEVGVLEEGLSQLRLPLLIIQTPLSIDEDAEVNLASGEEVIADLTSVVDLDLVQDLTIGYTWDDSREEEQVVRLTPEWFVKSQDKWTSLDDFMDQGGDV